MANKQLTATVRINVSQAEKSIERLNRKINTFNTALSKVGTNNQVESNLKRNDGILSNINNKIKQWANGQKGVNSATKSTSSLLSTVGSKLKSIAATYLGIMGVRSLVGVSDTITSAENKLNYVSAQKLGSSGLTLDGSYNDMVLNQTQEAMDKMYASSQKVRIGYTDMMSNVSKSMALAGDAFDNNIDNAIRFQEIMGEAYAVGGASAQEMSTSMYQMIQALGSGILAGDELRSVREGAPLAYQAIEKFAQGVYNTNDSLKEMASQGKITSDMVVAAIMNAGDQMDDAFNHTSQTFGQTWNQIKNAATYAFKPVSKMINDMLNEAIDNGMIPKIESLFTSVSKGLQIITKGVQIAINWIVDNWEWLHGVIVSGLLTFGTLLVASAIKGIIVWTILHWKILLIATAIFIVIHSFYLWQQGSITTCELILRVCAVIATAMVILGLVFHSVTLGIVGLIFGALLLIASQCSSVCEFIVTLAKYLATAICIILAAVLAVYIATGVIMLSVPMLIALAIIAIIAIVVGIFFQYTEEVMGCIYAAGAFIYNFITGILNAIMQGVWSIFVEPIAGIIEWFVNAWTGGFNGIGGAFANLLGQMLSMLIGFAKPVATIIDALFGTDTKGAISSAQTTLKSWGKNENATTYKVEAPTVQSLASSLGFNLPDRFSYRDSYNAGAKKGAQIKSTINSITDKINGLGKSFEANKELNNMDIWGTPKGPSTLDNIGKTLGLDFGDLNNGFPKTGLNATSPDIKDLLSNISDDTGKISDSMDLTNDDLEYLRKIADMEWRNEFTTAEIKVDMTNNNTVNGERDLDGIVTYLSDVLREEMYNVAYGVHY